MSFYFDMPIEELHQSVLRNPFEIEIWLTLIKRVAKEESAECALEEIFVAEEILPDSIERQAIKALCLMSLGETQEAHELLQQTLRRSPGDELADRLVNEFLPSFTNVTQDLLFNPYSILDHAEALPIENNFMERLESTIDLVRAYNDNECTPENMVQPLERHIQNFPDDINAKLDLARLCHNIGDRTKARRFYQLVILADPSCASAFFELATIEPDPDRAIDLSEKGLDLSPRFECGRYNYAALLLQSGMLREGRNEMLRLPADSPFYVSGLEAIANSYSEEGTFDDAAKFQEKVITRSPNNPEAWNCYGHFFAQMGDYEIALRHFDKVIELDSEHVDGLHNRALMLSRLGRNEEAIHVLKYALTIAPDEEALLVNLGVELNQLGRNPEAIDVLKEAVQKHPEYERLWQNLGNFHLQSGQISESIECSRIAVELDPGKGLAWWNIARDEAKLGNREQCLEALREGISRSPELADLIGDEEVLEPWRNEKEFRDLWQ